MVNETSVFEPLKFYYIYFMQTKHCWRMQKLSPIHPFWLSQVKRLFLLNVLSVCITKDFMVFVSPAKQKRDTGIANPASSSAVLAA